MDLQNRYFQNGDFQNRREQAQSASAIKQPYESKRAESQLNQSQACAIKVKASVFSHFFSLKMGLKTAVTLIVVMFICVCLSSLVSADRNRRDLLIMEYFFSGFPYNLILCFLCFVHGISLSLRQLKRILRQLNLRRRPSQAISRQTVEALIKVSCSCT